MSHRKIGQILEQRKVITPDQLATIVRRLPVPGSRIGQLFISAGMLGEVELSQALAEQSGLGWVDLGDYRIDDALLAGLPPDVIYRFRIIPLEYQNDCLVIAIDDPTDVLRIDELEMLLDRPLLLRVATESDIASLLKAGEGARRVLRDVSEDFMLHLVRETERGEEILSAESIVTVETSPIIKLVNTTLLDALERRASDIHIETGQRGVMIRYRIDGVLFQASELIDLQFQSPIISRLKVMSELDISERRVPQDGRFKVVYRNKSIDFRISIMPSVYGEDAVIRILDKESIASEMKELSLDFLGISERELPRIRRKIREPYGMVLVTGPTGSGKTTTLYAALTEIHSGEEKVITIEDPVEYLLQDVLQIPVNEKKGLTFARGLRSILRHDPDKIMVGEIRDAETAQIAVQSALTGHLVFTTVHANNALDVIGRFTHMGIDPYNFVSSLNCIMAQRLVRKLCLKCRRPVKQIAAKLQDAAIPIEQYQGAVLYESNGCDVCNGTGYLGRSAIVELIEFNDEFRDLIINKASMAHLKQAAQQQGTVFLREAAVEKFLSGDTSLREINRVTFVE